MFLSNADIAARPAVAQLTQAGQDHVTQDAVESEAAEQRVQKLVRAHPVVAPERLAELDPQRFESADTIGPAVL